MRRILPLCLATSLLALPAAAQDWPHWRGPSFDGSAEISSLPTSFSLTENVKWATALPGPGASTPIVVGERIYLTSIDEEMGLLLAICLDRDTGEERWIEPAGSGYQPGGKGTKTSLHRRSNYATPSATTDGERVVFFFGNGDLVSFTMEGERQWARNIQKDYGDFAFQWTFGASPTLWQGRIFLPVLQRNKPVHDLGKEGGESFLLAIDPETGKTLYRHVRPSPARNESLEAFATPIPYVDGGREEILIVGGDVITGHDPASGKELWRWGTWNPEHREEWWRVVPSAVTGAGLVLACGPKGAPVFAVKLGGEGDLGEAGLAWQSAGRRDPVTTDVPTPLFFDDDFFVLSDKRVALTRVDAKTGEHQWSIELPGEHLWRASPTGADGRIWLVDHGGWVIVVDPADGSILHRTRMAEGDEDLVRATIVPAHGSVFVRTNSRLFRIAK